MRNVESSVQTIKKYEHSLKQHEYGKKLSKYDSLTGIPKEDALVLVHKKKLNHVKTKSSLGFTKSNKFEDLVTKPRNESQ